MLVGGSNSYRPSLAAFHGAVDARRCLGVVRTSECMVLRWLIALRGEETSFKGLGRHLRMRCFAPGGFMSAPFMFLAWSQRGVQGENEYISLSTVHCVCLRPRPPAIALPPVSALRPVPSTVQPVPRTLLSGDFPQHYQSLCLFSWQKNIASSALRPNNTRITSTNTATAASPLSSRVRVRVQASTYVSTAQNTCKQKLSTRTRKEDPRATFSGPGLNHAVKSHSKSTPSPMSAAGSRSVNLLKFNKNMFGSRSGGLGFWPGGGGGGGWLDMVGVDARMEEGDGAVMPLPDVFLVT